MLGQRRNQCQRPDIVAFGCELLQGWETVSQLKPSTTVQMLKYATFGWAAQDPSKALLAVACQEGFVSILDTCQELPASLSFDAEGRRPSALWEAHRNIVHDLAWAKVRAHIHAMKTLWLKQMCTHLRPAA
jgi:hypothetical protein